MAAKTRFLIEKCAGLAPRGIFKCLLVCSLDGFTYTYLLVLVHCVCLGGRGLGSNAG